MGQERETEKIQETWTTQKPTRAGLYRYRLNSEDQRPCLLEISLSTGGQPCVQFDMGYESLKSYFGEWSGPIDHGGNTQVKLRKSRRGRTPLRGFAENK